MLVSFVIPSYNCVTWLPHAVSSALQQTHKDLEVIIVNDGSIDRTKEYLDFIRSEERVKIINLDKNHGVANARNIGNAEVKGDLIFVLDADDLATPNRVDLCLTKYHQTKADYIFGATTMINAVGVPIVELDTRPLDKKEFMYSGYTRIIHSSVCYTPKFAKEFPCIQSKLGEFGLDDWSQQVRAMQGGVKFEFVAQKLCAYRKLDSQTVAKRNNIEVLRAKRLFLDSLGLKDKIANIDGGLEKIEKVEMVVA